MSEENKLLFLQITNCDGIETANHYLEMCNNNLDQAIQLYFDTSAPQQQTGALNSNTSHAEDVRAPMSFNTQRLMNFSDNDEDEEDNQLSSNRSERMVVPGVVYGGVGGIFEEFITHHRQRILNEHNNAINTLRGDPNTADTSAEPSDDEYQNFSDDDISNSSSEASDEEIIMIDSSDEDSAEEYDDEIVAVDSNGNYDGNSNSTRATESHSDKFKKLFAKPTDILLSSNLTFSKVKNIAKKERKWLLVNIQNLNMFEAMKLNRDIWSDTHVKSIIKKSFMFVQYDHYQQAAKEYMFVYPFETKIPDSIRRMVEGDKIDNVIISNSTNEVIDLDMEETSDVYGDRLELPTIGIIDPVTGALMESWHGGIKDKTVFIKELEIFVHRYVHNNPDAVDLENDSLKQEDEMKNMPVEEELLKNDHKQVDSNVLLFNDIDPKANEEPSAAPLTTTRIQFRLFNSGKRVVRRFNKNDTIKTLFEFCKWNSENFPSNKYFQLVSSDNTNLIEHLNDTLEELDLLNSSITVEEILDEDEEAEGNENDSEK